jgi:hypothetical protein
MIKAKVVRWVTMGALAVIVLSTLSFIIAH